MTSTKRVVSSESSESSSNAESASTEKQNKILSSPAQNKHLSKKTRQGSIEIIDKNEFINNKDDEDIEKKEIELPDPKQNVDPDTFLASLLEAQYGLTLKAQDALSMKDGFFPEITEEQIAAYDIKMVVACRENKVDDLKSLVQDGQSAECCNRFGESLLHMACRRGFQEIVDYFIHDSPQLSVRIRDDCGRTPAHDACWNPQAQTTILKWLIEKDPSLLLMTDKRGSTPFGYARPQDWPLWRQFLLDNRSCLNALVEQKDLFQ